MKGRGQQGGVDFYGSADITVSLQHSACRKQMDKKWWKGLLRAVGGLALLPMLPLGNYIVCFVNLGVGTLLSEFYKLLHIPLEASLAAHGKREPCTAHCLQSHNYLGPERTKPPRETKCPSGMAGVCFSHLWLGDTS